MDAVYRNGGTMGLSLLPIGVSCVIAITYVSSRVWAIGEDFEISNTDFE